MISWRTILIGTLIMLMTFGVAAVALAAASGPPAEDASIYKNDPTLNQNADQLRVEAGDPSCSQTRWSYLKWNLADIPPGTTVGSATMSFYVNFISGTTTNALLTLYQVADDSWTEGGINFGNAPALGTIVQSVPIPAVNNLVTFNHANLVTYLQQEADGDNVASLALGLTGNCGDASVLVRMYSKDSPAADTPDPSLDIRDPNAITLRTFHSDDPAVSPVILGGAAVALLAVVAGIFVARRRRLAS